MQELIAITKTQINGAEVNSVNARNIHSSLNVKTHLSTWIKRAIEKYDFIENIDFSILKSGNPNGGLEIIDYIVTLDMAKELAMLENNAKGKEFRKYFIEVEKQANKPLTIADQIQLIAKGHVDIESRLDKIENNSRLTNQQEVALKTAKNEKVYQLAGDDKALASKLHMKVWSVFKKHFVIPRFNELQNGQFNDGLVYIRSLSLADLV